MGESDKARWIREHGAGEQHRSGRKRRGGKIPYKTWWAAAILATELNKRDGRDGLVHPYECRWADHWAHGETGELHWHLGRDRLL